MHCWVAAQILSVYSNHLFKVQVIKLKKQQSRSFMELISYASIDLALEMFVILFVLMWLAYLFVGVHTLVLLLSMSAFVYVLSKRPDNSE